MFAPAEAASQLGDGHVFLSGEPVAKERLPPTHKPPPPNRFKGAPVFGKAASGAPLADGLPLGVPFPPVDPFMSRFLFMAGVCPEA